MEYSGEEEWEKLIEAQKPRQILLFSRREGGGEEERERGRRESERKPDSQEGQETWRVREVKSINHWSNHQKCALILFTPIC